MPLDVLQRLTWHGEPKELGDFNGLKLIGFSIWERKVGNGRNVTFPARQA